MDTAPSRNFVRRSYCRIVFAVAMNISADDTPSHVGGFDEPFRHTLMAIEVLGLFPNMLGTW